MTFITNKKYIVIFFLWNIYNPVLSQASELAELDCMVKPEMYVELSSPVGGILETLLIKKSDVIKKGQPLAELEASVEIAKVNLAELEAASYSSEIQSRKTKLQYAKRHKTRLKGLYSKNSVSLLEKDKAETEVAVAIIELKKAIEQKQIAKLNTELTKTYLALKTIKSPIDGIVVDIYAMVGESVADRAIMKLAQVDPLTIELIAPTEYFGLIKKNMAVEIQAERPANKSYKARVTIVDQLIDPASGSFTVRMALPNPGDQLIGGVNCIARFNFDMPQPSFIQDTFNLIGSEMTESYAQETEIKHPQ